MEELPEVDRLIGALRSGDGPAQRQAAEQLAGYGPSARRAVPALIGTMDDQPDNEVTDAAWNALMKIGTVAIPDLVQIVRDKGVEERTRFLAADTLADLGPAALPTLMALIDDEDVCVRMAAIEAVPRVGAEAETALAKLARIFHDPDAGRLCHSSAIAIAQISSDSDGTPDRAASAVRTLLDALRHGDLERRRAAASAMRFTKEAGMAVISELERARADPDGEVRRYADWALDLIAGKT